jgi:phospholipase C
VWERLERHELNRRGRGMAAPAPGRRPVTSLPAGTDLLPQIKHIVVLMMENHSYDSYLGMLAGRGEGFRLGRDGQPEAANPNADGKMIRGYHAQSTRQADGVPCQSWHASHLQWNDGRMDGFVTATLATDQGADETVAMAYWTERDLPFYYGLARTFPLADHWFGSCLGPTFPNRRFLIAGTANGLIDDLPLHLLDYPPNGTIFDQLSRHGISWANYHPVQSDESRFRRLARHKRRMARRRLWRVGEGLRHVADVGKDIVFTADLFPLGVGRHMLHVRSADAFFDDADKGTLPAFSIVDPSFQEFSEECPQDIRKG